MAGATAFGKPIDSSTASAVLNALSLNASPSPDEPQQMPPNEMANLYAQLLFLASEAARKERDPVRGEQLVAFVAFADRAVRDVIEAQSSGGAPVPSNLQIPPPAPPPQAAPPGAGAGAAPMGAPAAMGQAPGPGPSPTPPGLPA